VNTGAGGRNAVNTVNAGARKIGRPHCTSARATVCVVRSAGGG
jgi:hypothetical protein